MFTSTDRLSGSQSTMVVHAGVSCAQLSSGAWLWRVSIGLT
jgi:hypothetical protein